MATWYISPTGDDTNGDGSQTNPWKTLNKAYSSAADGDTIILMDGTYSGENIDPYSKDLTFRSQNPPSNGIWHAIIDGNNNFMHFRFGAPKSMTFDGVKFENIITEGSTGNHNLFAVGLYNPGKGTYTINLLNCMFQNITITVDNSYNAEALIGVNTNTSEYILDLTIDKCLFVDFKEAGSINNSHLITTRSEGSSGTWNILNSTFYFKETTKPIYSLFYVTSTNNVTTLIVKNCIFRNKGGSILYGNAAAISNTSASYTCFNNISNSPSGIGVINLDPLFVDEDSYDFNLSPSSPCIDTGVLI